MPILFDNYQVATLDKPAIVNTYSLTDSWVNQRDGKNWFNASPTSSVVVSEMNATTLNRHVTNLLDEFSTLQDNWDEDDAVAPNLETLNRVKQIVNVLSKNSQKIFHAAPGPYGEIMLDLRNENDSKQMEFIFYSNRSVVVFSENTSVPTQDSFSKEKLQEYLMWLNN